MFEKKVGIKSCLYSKLQLSSPSNLDKPPKVNERMEARKPALWNLPLASIWPSQVSEKKLEPFSWQITIFSAQKPVDHLLIISVFESFIVSSRSNKG